MAKQHRPRPRVAARPSRKPARVTPRKPARVGQSTKAAPAPTPAPAVNPPVAAPVIRPTHLDAVGIYEQGLQALQKRDYARAAELLSSVLDRYPEEKELHDRIRIYLNVCERQAVPPDRTPKSVEERVYAATLSTNAGDYDGSLAELERLAVEAPDNDHVHYMLAVVHTLRGEMAAAIPHLQRAVELNGDNRFLAFQDADLEVLRQDPVFQGALDGVGSGRRERRGQPARSRPPR